MAYSIYLAGPGKDSIKIGSLTDFTTSYRGYNVVNGTDEIILNTDKNNTIVAYGTGISPSVSSGGTYCYFNMPNGFTRLNLTLWMNEGYEFEKDITICTSSSGSGVLGTATKDSNNRYTFSLTNTVLKLTGTSVTGTHYLYIPNVVSAAQTFNIAFDLINCTTDFTDTTVKERDKIDIILTSNDGYHFDEENRPYLTNGEKTTTSIIGTKQAVFSNITVNGNINVYGEAVADTEQFTVTQNLENCTSNIEDGKYDKSSQLVCELTCNDGYYFDVVPDANGLPFNLNDDKTIASITLDVEEDIEINGSGNIREFVCDNQVTGFELFNGTIPDIWKSTDSKFISFRGSPRINHLVMAPYILEDNGTRYTFRDQSSIDYYLYSITYQPKDNFTIYGAYYEEAKLNVTFNLVGCTANYEAGQVSKDTKLNIVLTPISEFATFEQTPKAYMDNTWYDFIVSEDGKEATLDITVTHDIEIDATATVVSATITYDLVNATIYPNPSKVEKGDTVIFNITAREGYTINKPPTITIGRNEPIEFVKSDESDIWTYDYLSNGVDAKISVVADIEESGLDGYGYINVYVVSQKDLDNLSQDNYFRVHTSSSGAQVEYIDTSKYILTLRCIYLNIPTQAIEPIKYGGFTSRKGEGGIPSNIYVETTIGKINIPIVYNNSIDFSNTVLALYLPFIGEVQLNTTRYMGQEIELTYRTNIITGNTTARITSSNGIEEYFNGDIGFELPIHYENVINQNLDGDKHSTDGFKPFLIVERGIPAINNDEEPEYTFFGKNVDFTAILNTISGYSVIDAIELVQNNNMYKEDIDEIESILNGGIIL